MNSDPLQLPPSYIDATNAATWLIDLFNSPYGLPCVCGDQTDGNDIYVVRPHIVQICQREDNPCMVEVKFHLGTANGLWTFDDNLSAFSVDTSNGVNGSWFQLRPEIGDPNHNTSVNNTALAGTKTVDASWNYSLYNPNNPGYNTQDPCVPNYETLGIPVHTFVFDMCEHVSSWLSEPAVSFRLTFTSTARTNSPPLSCGVRVNYGL